MDAGTAAAGAEPAIGIEKRYLSSVGAAKSTITAGQPYGEDDSAGVP
jgi:hypothetical protein